METVGEKRSTWTRWNLHAEASRQLMGWRFVNIQDREAITGLVVDAAEHASLRLTPPELASSHEDGTGEDVDDLVLPHGISDVWFRGRASRDAFDPLGVTQLRLARFQATSGWHR